MVVIGIDPGLGGAISIIEEFGECVFDMPTFIMKNKKRDIDCLAIKNILQDHSPDMVFIEKAQSMPNQGVVGIFTYGKGYGKILGVIEAEEIPYKEIPARNWKMYFGLTKTKSGKKYSVEMAEHLYPDLKKDFYGPKGGLKDGRAEAVLIAQYGYEKFIMDGKNDK